MIVLFLPAIVSFFVVMGASMAPIFHFAPSERNALPIWVRVRQLLRGKNEAMQDGSAYEQTA